MKLLFFDDFKLGVLKGDTVVDVSEVVQDIPHIGPQDLISGRDRALRRVRGHAWRRRPSRGSGVPVAQVRIRPPLPKPATSSAWP